MYSKVSGNTIQYLHDVDLQNVTHLGGGLLHLMEQG